MTWKFTIQNNPNKSILVQLNVSNKNTYKSIMFQPCYKKPNKFKLFEHQVKILYKKLNCPWSI